MHPARFATWHDLRHLVTNRLNEEGLILGQTPSGDLVRIVPTPQRPHLGHMLIVGRSQCGKTMNLATEISNWPGPVIANDPKDGEVHALTGDQKQTRQGDCV